MPKRLTAIAMVCAVQGVTVSVGVAWGLAASHGIRWINGQFSLAGGLAVLLLSGEGLRRLVSHRLRIAKPLAPCVCIGLAAYAAWLMSVEAFLWYIDDGSFLQGILRVLPFLLAMSPLVRAGAWPGVIGTAIFSATVLAMLIRNGCSLLGGSGFFVNWVS